MTPPSYLLGSVTYWLALPEVRASAVMAAALAASWLLRGRVHPAIVSAMWLVVVLRLMVPWSIPITLLSAAPVRGASASAVAVATPENTQQTKPTDATIVSLPPLESARGRDKVLIAWAAGCCGLFLLQLGLYLRFAFRLKTSKASQNLELNAIYRALCLEMGIRRVPRLVESAGVNSPCLFGIARPHVIFPLGMVEHLGPSAFRHIVAHELAHVKRWDTLSQLLASLAACVHWFNPLAWLVAARMRADAEIAADARALAFLAEGEAPAYGETLLTFARRTSLQEFAMSAPAVGSAANLRERIRMIATQNTFTTGQRTASLALICLAGAATFVQPVAKAADTRANSSQKLSAEGERWREKLSACTSLHFENIALKEFLDFCAKAHGVSFVYSPGASTKVSGTIPYVRLKNATLASCVDLLTREYGLVCKPAKDVLWIGANDEEPAPAVGVLAEPILAQAFGRTVSREGLLEALNAPVSIELENTGLRDVMPILADSYSINIVLDPRVTEVGSFSIPLVREINVPLREVLAKLLNTNTATKVDNNIELLEVRALKDKPALALIATGKSVKWYQAGEAFEQYTLNSVDPTKKTALVHDDSLGKPLTLKTDEAKDPRGNKTLSRVTGLDFSVEEDYIWISSPDLLHKEARWYGK